MPGLSAPFIGPVLFGVEFAAVVTISVLTGVLYHLVILGREGDVATFLAVGIVTYFDFGMVLAYRGNYKLLHLMSEWRQVREATAAWVLTCLFLFAVAFLLKIGPNFSRGATLLFFAFAGLYVVTSRYLLAKCLSSGRGQRIIGAQRVIILSDGDFSPNSLAHIGDIRQSGYDPVKYFVMGQSADDSIASVVHAARHEADVSGIFLIMNWGDVERIRDVVRKLSVIPLPVNLLLQNDMAQLLRRPPVEFKSFWAAELQRGPLSVPERIMKRMLDVTVASLALLALLPLMGFVALLIKLDSWGPALFLQTRAGFNGRPFRILKFRTLSTLDDGAIVRQVSRNDHRLTRIGRVLRKTSIDELPQLLNVLRGDMSLVGPRPHAAAHNTEYERVIANYAFRHHVKPGLTGLAQVNGMRGETTIETMQRRIDLDLWYIDNWSLWLDVKIILRTAVVVLRQSSAY